MKIVKNILLCILVLTVLTTPEKIYTHALGKEDKSQEENKITEGTSLEDIVIEDMKEASNCVSMGKQDDIKTEKSEENNNKKQNEETPKQTNDDEKNNTTINSTDDNIITKKDTDSKKDSKDNSTNTNNNQNTRNTTTTTTTITTTTVTQNNNTTAKNNTKEDDIKISNNNATKIIDLGQLKDKNINIGVKCKIVWKYNSKVLAIRGESTEANFNAIVSSYTASKNQIFIIEKAQNNNYILRVENSGKCLQMTNDKNVVQVNYEGLLHQMWKIKDAGNGDIVIVSQRGDKVLDVENGIVVCNEFNSLREEQRWTISSL